MAITLQFKVFELDNGFVLEEDGKTSAKDKLGNIKGAINKAIEEQLNKEFPETFRSTKRKILHINIEMVDDNEIPKQSTNDLDPL